MSISSFDELLEAAALQPQADRLLFVFCTSELPDTPSLEQREAFSCAQGGALAPLMCVDKLPSELRSFAQLRDEAEKISPQWQLVFVAALAGLGRQAPTSKDADIPLRDMVEGIKRGDLGAYIPFDRSGTAVRLS